MIDEKFTIVQEDRFIEATRDSGYRSTANAISELADNAFQAGANNFTVHFESETELYSGRGKPKSPRIKEVVCIDDGSGMPPDVLRNALRFGGTSRFNDREGLGRFGMGLPNASVSQCRRVEVFTWQNGGKVYSCFIDVDEIAKGKMLVVPEPVVAKVPEEYEGVTTSKSGTIVVWKKCDRLDYSAREDTLTRELPKSLGRIYRYYLVSGKRIVVNGRDIKPFDPLFLMPEAEYFGATEHGGLLKFWINVPNDDEQTSPVAVKFSLLPEEWQAKIGKSKTEMQKRDIERSRGFSVVRCGREIDHGYFGLRSPHWTDSWWSCEIAFEPALDELFGVTHTKQQVKLSEQVRTTIEKDINANIATLAEMIVARGKRRHAANTRMAEEIAKEQDKFLRTAPDIRDKNPDVAAEEVREYAEEQATDDKPREQIVEDLQGRPFLMDFENLPGAPFYRVRTVGRTTVVALNREHPFFDKIYNPICDYAPDTKTAIELLLFALAKCETLVSEEGLTWYRTQRAEWSQVLRVYLEGVESLSKISPERIMAS
jgi:hypothetical protein